MEFYLLYKATNPLHLTTINDVIPNTNVNIVGILSRSFSAPRRLNNKSFYLHLNIQGIMIEEFVLIVYIVLQRLCNLPCIKNMTNDLSDETSGDYSSGSGGIVVNIFSDRLDELPPLEGKGDVIFLHDVEICEWTGRFLLFS